MTLRLMQLLAGASAPDHHELASELNRISGADSTIVFLFDGSILRVGGAWPRVPDAEARLRVRPGQAVSGKVALNGHAILLGRDVPRSPLMQRLLGLEPGAAVARLCLPARAPDGQILAVVSHHRAPSRPFIGADLAELQPLVDLVALRLSAEHLMDAVDAHRNDRDRLIAQAISAQEAERRRIAFDLHDGVTTALASMAFHLNAAELSLGNLPEPTGGPLAQALTQIGAARSLGDLAYNQTRAAITGLHSLVLDDHGLVAALETLVETAPDGQVELDCDPESSFAEVSNHAAAALFRIAQETISNAVRHAQATRVQVSLRCFDGHVVLETSDDGVGFDLRATGPTAEDPLREASDGGHLGLSSIAERCALIGAELRIDSMPGHGTSVIVELPVLSG